MVPPSAAYCSSGNFILRPVFLSKWFNGISKCSPWLWQLHRRVKFLAMEFNILWHDPSICHTAGCQRFRQSWVACPPPRRLRASWAASNPAPTGLMVAQTSETSIVAFWQLTSEFDRWDITQAGAPRRLAQRRVLQLSKLRRKPRLLVNNPCHAWRHWLVSVRY
jgi:hypothetical protein